MKRTIICYFAFAAIAVGVVPEVAVTATTSIQSSAIQSTETITISEAIVPPRDRKERERLRRELGT